MLFTMHLCSISLIEIVKMKEITLSTNGLNRDGYRVMTEGLQLENFRKNPVIMYNHALGGMPIGRWTNIRVENDKLLATPVFDEKDELGAVAKRKYEEGFLSAVSIGFIPLTFSKDVKYLLPGQTYETVLTADVIEASFVPIPSNPKSTLSMSVKPNTLGIPKLRQKNISDENQLNMKEIAKALGLPESSNQKEIVTAIQVSKKRELSAKVEQVINLGKTKGIVKETNAEHYRKIGLADLESLKAIIDEAPNINTSTQNEEGLNIAETIKKSLLNPDSNNEDENTFESLSKNNPTELLRIQKEEPEKYKQLAYAYVNSK